MPDAVTRLSRMGRTAARLLLLWAFVVAQCLPGGLLPVAAGAGLGLALCTVDGLGDAPGPAPVPARDHCDACLVAGATGLTGDTPRLATPQACPLGTIPMAAYGPPILPLAAPGVRPRAPPVLRA